MHFVKLLHLSMSLEFLHFQYPLTVVVRMEEHLILIKMVVVNAIVQTIQWEIPVKQVKGYFFLTKYNFNFIYNQCLVIISWSNFLVCQNKELAKWTYPNKRWSVSMSSEHPKYSIRKSLIRSFKHNQDPYDRYATFIQHPH